MNAFFVSYTKSAHGLFLEELEKKGIRAKALLTDFDSVLAGECSTRFPDLTVFDLFNTRRGLFPETVESYSLKSGVVADQDVLLKLSPYEPVIMEMFNRMDGDGVSFPYSQRKRLYRDLVKKWSDVLDQLDIGLLVSRNIPHFPSEYVLYLLCQQRGIPTLLTEITPVNYKKFFIDSIHERGKFFYGFDLADFPDSHEAVTNAVNDVVPEHTKMRVVESSNESKLAVKLGLLWKKLFQFFEKGFRISKMATKKNARPLSDDSAWYTYLGKYFYFRRAWGKIRRNRAFYESLASEIDLNQNFVFLPAHYQPERTTCPDAFYYGDMLAIAELISHNLPSGWSLVYKEHPTNFMKPGERQLRGHLARDEEYYSRLAALPNVKIASMKQDTPSLLGNAGAVACATGTAGWEAAAKSVPCLVFGESWYSKCPAFLRIQNRTQLLEAFQKIQAGFKPQQKDLVELCWRVEKLTEKAIPLDEFDSIEKLSSEKQSAIMSQYAELLYDTIKRDPKLEAQCLRPTL